MAQDNGNTSVIAIIGLVVIVVLLALYFYTDLGKKGDVVKTPTTTPTTAPALTPVNGQNTPPTQSPR